VLLSVLALTSLSNGANLDMFVSTSTRTLVDKDLSNTYGLKFCLRSDQGIVLTFTKDKGVYDPYVRYQAEVGKNTPDFNVLRYLAASSVAARNYRTDLVDFTQTQCFWTMWLHDWYMFGSGSVWGENLLMNFKNVTETTFGGLYVNTKFSGQAYVTFIDEILSQADAQTYQTSAMYIPQAFAGPVQSSDLTQLPTFTAATATGGAYQPVNCDLTGSDYISFSVTTNYYMEGGYIGFYDVNDANYLNNACWVNPFRYQFAFMIGTGADVPRDYNLNAKAYVPAPDGTAMTAWVYWKNGRFSAGMGDTVGVNPVVLDQFICSRPVNRMMIKSKDMPVAWTFAKRYCVGM